MKDPIVEEIRRIRDEHSKLFNYDLDAICEDYKTRQNKTTKRLVRLKPKLLSQRQPLQIRGNSFSPTPPCNTIEGNFQGRRSCRDD